MSPGAFARTRRTTGERGSASGPIITKFERAVAMTMPELSPYEDELGQPIGDVGWTSLFETEPGAAVRLLLARYGPHGLSGRALSLIMTLAIGQPVAGLVRDGEGAALVLPASGLPTAAAKPVGCLSVEVDGVSLCASTDRLIVIAELAGQHVLGECTVPKRAIRPADFGSDLGLRRIRGRGLFKAVRLLNGADPLVAWRRAVAIGRLAVASQLATIGHRVLQSSVNYATNRAPRPQHALPGQFTEIKAELTVARSAVLNAANDFSSTASALANLLAGRAATPSRAYAQHVDAGLGLTCDPVLDGDARRVSALNSLLGNTNELARDVGDWVASFADWQRLEVGSGHQTQCYPSSALEGQGGLHADR
jgi:hypothetical protein